VRILGDGEASGRFGATLAAQNIDGDADDDIVIGAPETDDSGRSTGAVWIVDGVSPAEVSGTLSYVEFVTEMSSIAITGGESGDLFGTSVALADVNGTGRLDLAVGAPGVDSDEGEVTVLYNMADLLECSEDGSLYVGFEGQPHTAFDSPYGSNDAYGTVVATIGDFGELTGGVTTLPELAVHTAEGDLHIIPGLGL
jgi:hypothetical protein